jgi:ketosteroid isomerase-like protein
MDPDERRLFEEGSQAYAARGADGLAESWDEGVVYEEDPLWPGAGTYRGREAVLARFREYEEQLGRGATTIEHVVERPGRAIVIWRHEGVTPGSGVPFEHRWAWLVESRGGKSTRIRAFFDPDQALQAAGGDEPTARPD